VEAKNCLKSQTVEGDESMKKTKLTIPELALIAGTRGMLGAGAALLIGNKLSEGKRKAVGWTLFLTGALSTIPLAIGIFGKRR
jgi:hypothetical protein